jgi:sarcosine oxidase subunit beta
MPDFVIVGGGVYGCGVAWELGRRGVDVQLLEADTIAAGASGGLGKRGVRANARDLRELPLMGKAYELWPDLAEKLGGQTGYERTGGLELIEHPTHLQHAESQVWLQRQYGIPSELLDAAEVKAKEPLVSDKVIGAVYCPKDGDADHSTTTKAYAQAADQLGAVIHEQKQVIGFEHAAGRISHVITGDQAVVPVRKAVLLLTNMSSRALVAEHFGLSLPIWELLPQVILTEPLDHQVVQHLIGHSSRRLAIKAVPGGQIMISGGWHGRWNSQTGRGETLSDQIEGNYAEAAAVFPSLADIGIQQASANRPEAISVDDIPIIDHVPGVDNLILATGWSGHGWAIAPAVCELLAVWALTRTRPDLLEPFGLERFRPS